MMQHPNRWEFEKLGTQWAIETSRPLSDSLKRHITDRLEAYDATYSRFRDDSIVMRMHARPGIFVFPEDFPPLYAFYRELYQLTNGKLTPLIGSMLEQAGYDKEYSMKPGMLDRVPDLEHVIHWDDSTTITTTQPITLDIGAAGKGYAVDLIATLIEEEVAAYVIDASGDIRHRGKRSERIGLEHPGDPTKVIGVMDLQNKSLCASASNRRAWQGLHHIFDPTTKRPVERVVATWVLANDTLHADGLATALFFVDTPHELLKRFDCDFVRMFYDGSVDYSPGFEGELFI